MLKALNHNKLSYAQENLEDILTSNVFGMLEYMDTSTPLIQFLSRATNLQGSQLDLPDPDDQLTVKYRFWPRYEEPGCTPCEPDVVIDVSHQGNSIWRILVEAKLHSDKSSFPDPLSAIPTDQLTKEWHNLIYNSRRTLPRSVKLAIVYLTGHRQIPVREIRDSIEEFSTKCPVLNEEQPMNCFWLSWRILHKVLSGHSNTMVRDLLLMLDRLNQTYFRGLKPIKITNELNYSFLRLPQVWKFSLVPKTQPLFRFRSRHNHQH